MKLFIRNLEKQPTRIIFVRVDFFLLWCLAAEFRLKKADNCRNLEKYLIGKVNGLSPGSKVFKMHIR